MNYVLSVLALTVGLACQDVDAQDVDPQGVGLKVLKEPLEFRVSVMESAPPQFNVYVQVRCPTSGYRIKLDSWTSSDAQGRTRVAASGTANEPTAPGRIRALVTAIAPSGPVTPGVEVQQAVIPLRYCEVGDYMLEVHWRSADKGAYRYRSCVALTGTDKHGHSDKMGHSKGKKIAYAWDMALRDRLVSSQVVASKAGPRLSLGFATIGRGWQLRVDEVGKPTASGRIRVAVTGQAPAVVRPIRLVKQVPVDLGRLASGRYVVEVFYRADKDDKHELFDLVLVAAR